MKRESQLCILLYLIIAIGLVRSFQECRNNETGSGGVNDESYRLPTEVVPIKYTVDIQTDNDGHLYDGHMKILLKVLKPTSTIVLHNDGLQVLQESVVLERANFSDDQLAFTSVPLDCYLYDTKRQFYVLKSLETLGSNEYRLKMLFRGKVRDDVFGFYRSSYDENLETKWMAVTQFSPTYARRAFPCMDEPHLKAVFQFSFTVDNHTVTSNTELDYYDPLQNKYQFKETPRMSTYLVGWAMHQFVVDNATSNFRMWTRRTMEQRGSVALHRGQMMYSFLENWFRIENPIPKMDQVAVPDFNFHAMENWGMITYRESVVLYEDGETPTKYMVDGLTTMGHEYTHTWFGNLVTPMFWDVAWLKEGFASYFPYLALSTTQPSWKMMDKFVVDMLQSAMLLDSTNHDRAMNGHTDGDPTSAMTMLDFVTYKKGASVIRMMSYAIGDSIFQEGLRSYLKDMSYQAATPFDLYKHLQNSIDKSGQPQFDASIQEIMESWTSQPGYPVVNVTRCPETRKLMVSQERFSWSSNKTSSQWWVPLSFTTEELANFSNPRPTQWLKPNVNGTVIDGVAPDQWVILNVQQTGYYRVNYDEQNWRLLTSYLNSDYFYKIHKSNRAALIDDAFNLARAGYVDYSVPLKLASYLTREREYEPWVAAVNNFKFLNKMLNNVPDVQRAFQDYSVRLLRNMYEQLNFTESTREDVTVKLHRELILSASCLLRNNDCLNVSETLFQNWNEDPLKIVPRDVKSFVYCEAIRNGPEDYWTTAMARWLYVDLQIEQDLLLKALGCTRRPDLVKSHLELSISDDHDVRKQQRMIIVNAVLDGNAENVDHVLEFVRSNLQRIIELRGHDFLGKMITAIGNAMITEEQTEKLLAFIQSNSEQLGSALDAANKALSVATENMEWVKQYVPSIAKYFQ